MTRGIMAPARARPPSRPVPVVPPDDLRLLLSRFSYGVTDDLLRDALRMSGGVAGGAGLRWLEQQLDPDSIADEEADEIATWWRHLWWTPRRLYKAGQSGDLSGFTVSTDFQRWTLVHRIRSRRHVLEVMAEFWANHLHVPTPLPMVYPVRVSYDQAIRTHALGRFDDLLVAAILHPAMLLYLDGAKSSAKAPNENLGRELLELHTVGHDAGISQQDVVDSARILTGWRVDRRRTWERSYDATKHFVGEVRVFDFTDPNADPDGRDLAVRYLRWLAQHPATAQRIAAKLVRRFVTDTPPEAGNIVGQLVSDVASVFRASGTDIKETLRALVTHEAFTLAASPKVRTPTEDLVNSYRVLRIALKRPRRSSDAAHHILASAKRMGQAPFDWPAPDGFPDDSRAWSSASRVLGSWFVHRQLATGNVPVSGVTFPPPESWLPDMPCTFAELVDHLCRRILVMPATDLIVDVASRATGYAADDVLESDDRLIRRFFEQVLLAILDSPEHMTR